MIGFERAAIAEGSVERQPEILIWASARCKDALTIIGSVVRNTGLCLAKLAVYQQEDLRLTSKETRHIVRVNSFTDLAAAE